MSTNYDHEYDVIVVGSGNGALTSAICSHDGGAKVLVIEKSNQYVQQILHTHIFEVT